MKEFIDWWLEYPEYAAIGLCVGAVLGLITGWLLDY